MTQEEKKLLIKDLCSRLPYDTVIHYHWEKKETNAIVDVDRELDFSDVDSLKYTLTDPQDDWCIIDWKPYLRPMSSMTEEELNECVCQSGIKGIGCPNWQDIPKEKQFEARLNHAIAVFLTDSKNVDWLLSHHFDFRGLIEKGLALKAPEGMYKS